MTNFEHMKERVLDTVTALGQEELWQLTVDTCMDVATWKGSSPAGFARRFMVTVMSCLVETAV